MQTATIRSRYQFRTIPTEDLVSDWLFWHFDVGVWGEVQYDLLQVSLIGPDPLPTLMDPRFHQHNRQPQIFWDHSYLKNDGGFSKGYIKKQGSCFDVVEYFDFIKLQDAKHLPDIDEKASSSHSDNLDVHFPHWFSQSLARWSGKHIFKSQSLQKCWRRIKSDIRGNILPLSPVLKSANI